MFLRFGSKRSLIRIALVGSHKALANTAGQALRCMLGPLTKLKGYARKLQQDENPPKKLGETADYVKRRRKNKIISDISFSGFFYDDR